MKTLSNIGLSLMVIGVLIISHASIYNYGVTTGRNESVEEWAAPFVAQVKEQKRISDSLVREAYKCMEKGDTYRNRAESALLSIMKTQADSRRINQLLHREYNMK